MRMILALASLAAAIGGLAPHAGAAQHASALAPAFSAKELTASPTDSWITNGGNVYNQRYSPLTRINRDNVAQLKPQWRVLKLELDVLHPVVQAGLDGDVVRPNHADGLPRPERHGDDVPRLEFKLARDPV